MYENRIFGAKIQIFENAILASFWKSEACGQIVFPDMSVLIGQKLVENITIQKFKCDILRNFQTMWDGLEVLTKKGAWNNWRCKLHISCRDDSLIVNPTCYSPNDNDIYAKTMNESA